MTKRKQAETALKESEERFKALHNASFGGIGIHDRGLIIECNNGLSEITGYSYQELIGMDGLSLISDDTRATVIHNINTGYEKPYEVKGVRKNGEIYPVRLEARNIPYQGKNVRVVEFRDLTETKRFEKEKENLEGQLLQAQKMEAVGKLAVPPFFGSSIKRQDQLSNIAAIHTLIWITEFRLPPNGVGR
ncbi:PAS domain S-box protein [Desulfosarcina variabilis]|uniref:PAS domain-containing protein n=1 Tax=Desulfosarcina variabilis TaxID=2300 RepID=UPI003AFB7AFE